MILKSYFKDAIVPPHQLDNGKIQTSLPYFESLIPAHLYRDAHHTLSRRISSLRMQMKRLHSEQVPCCEGSNPAPVYEQLIFAQRAHDRSAGPEALSPASGLPSNALRSMSAHSALLRALSRCFCSVLGPLWRVRPGETPLQDCPAPGRRPSVLSLQSCPCSPLPENDGRGFRNKKFKGMDKSENCHIFSYRKPTKAPISADHSEVVFLKLI